MMIFAGLLTGTVGVCLLAAALVMAGTDGAIYAALAGLGAVQLSAVLVLGAVILRAIDEQVRGNFEKLFMFLAEVPASRRAMDMFTPPETLAVEVGTELRARGIRTLRRRTAVA